MRRGSLAEQIAARLITATDYDHACAIVIGSIGEPDPDPRRGWLGIDPLDVDMTKPEEAIVNWLFRDGSNLCLEDNPDWTAAWRVHASSPANPKGAVSISRLYGRRVPVIS